VKLEFYKLHCCSAWHRRNVDKSGSTIYMCAWSRAICIKLCLFPGPIHVHNTQLHKFIVIS